MGLTTLQKFVLGLVAFILLVIGWGMFPLFFKWLMIEIGSEKTKLEDFGTLGDIYGSLNTLFTSATLLIVIYSAYLQRQANLDTRKAMADQLKQARDATAKQLRQARQSLKEQLDQTRDAHVQQMSLAYSTSQAQIKESKYAIFANIFNFLLNHKHEKYLSIQTTKGERTYQAHEVFTHINIEMVNLVKNEWKDISKLTEKKIEEDFFKTMRAISNIGNYSEIFVYLMNLKNIFEFINRSSIDAEDKEFYKFLVKDTMTTGEQAALFWLGSYDDEVRQMAEDEQCIDLSYNNMYMPFAVKFYTKECFRNKLVHENWDRFANKEETPA